MPRAAPHEQRSPHVAPALPLASSATARRAERRRAGDAPGRPATSQAIRVRRPPPRRARRAAATRASPVHRAVIAARAREGDRGRRGDERAEVHGRRERDEIRRQQQPATVATRRASPADWRRRPASATRAAATTRVDLRLGRVRPHGDHRAGAERRREPSSHRCVRARRRGPTSRASASREPAGAAVHTAENRFIARVAPSSGASSVRPRVTAARRTAACPADAECRSTCAAAMNSPASQNVTPGASVSDVDDAAARRRRATPRGAASGAALPRASAGVTRRRAARRASRAPAPA